MPVWLVFGVQSMANRTASILPPAPEPVGVADASATSVGVAALASTVGVAASVWGARAPAGGVVLTKLISGGGTLVAVDSAAVPPQPPSPMLTSSATVSPRTFL